MAITILPIFSALNFFNVAPVEIFDFILSVHYSSSFISRRNTHFPVFYNFPSRE